MQKLIFIHYMVVGAILFSTSLSIAQSTESEGSVVVPPSPNVSSLTNQISESVQLYTGALNVKIPVFDLKGRELSHSVFLSYNGSGNKVNDLASWIGLGWTLNAGGAIGRTMRGIPDEYVGSMTLPSTNGSSVPAKGWLDPDVRGGTNQDLFQYFTGTTQTNREKLIQYSNKTGDYVSLGGTPKVWDTEPDEFNFHFGQYSGKFIFDSDGNAQIIPHQNLEITKVITSKTILGSGYPSQQITSFTIKDSEGITYTFGNPQVTSASSLTAVETTGYSQFTQKIQCGFFFLGDVLVNGTLPLHTWDIFPFMVREGGNSVPSVMAFFQQDYMKFTSSWYLAKIESPTGDAINFNYTSDGQIKFIVSQNQDMDQINLDLFEFSNGEVRYGTFFTEFAVEIGQNRGFAGGSAMGGSYQPQTVSLTTTYNTIQSKRLDNIASSTGEKIEFTAALSRPDLAGGNALQEIRVKDYQGNLKKQYALKYGYTETPLDFHVFWFPDLAGPPFPIDELSFGFQAWADVWTEMVGFDHRRLFLTEFQEVSSAGNVLAHKFDYYLDEILPRRMSYMQDWFGFYNNNTAGHQIPKSGYSSTGIGSGSEFFFSWVQGGVSQLSRDPNFSRANKATHPTRVMAGVLKSIVFPTGGKKEFIFDRSKNVDGGFMGGVSIKEIRSYQSVNSATYESTAYNYLGGNYARHFNEQTFILQLPQYPYPRARVSLSSSSITESYLTKGCVGGYQMVEEVKLGIGKKKYYFSNPTDIPNTRELIYRASDLANGTSLGGYKMNPMNDMDHKRGNLLKVEVLNENGQVLTRETNVYDVTNSLLTPKTTYAIKPMRSENFWADLSGGEHNNPIFFAGFYKYTNDWIPLKQTITEIFDQSDPGNVSKVSVRTTDYTYAKPNSSTIEADLLPRKITQTLPSNEKVVSEIKYPRDYVITGVPSESTAKGIYLLKSLKIESKPIESIAYLEKIDGSKYLMGGALTKFKEFTTGKPLFFESYKFKSGSGISYSTYTWSYIDGSNNFIWPSASSFKLASSVLSYDTYGNPSTGINADGITSNYSWGYNNSLLTAIIANPGTYQHATTYEHAPLIGLLKVNDPNGQSSKYEYDPYNRLKLTKDDKGQILTKYFYHYQNESQTIPTTATASVLPGCRAINNSVSFQGSLNSSIGGENVEWNFGDGAIVQASAGTVNHSYTSIGTYTVTAVISHPDYYGTSKISFSVTIYPTLTVAVIDADPNGTTDYDVCTYDPSFQYPTFTLNTNGYQSSVQWYYRMNGGSWISYAGGSPLGYGDSGPGTWDVKCVVNDGCGNQATSNIISLLAYASTPNCPIP